MTLRFGLELEGFYQTAGGIGLPPENYPTDGFPGLVEFRTDGPNKLDDAGLTILGKMLKFPGVDFGTTEHVFTPEQKSKLRGRAAPPKTPLQVRNIYGLKPRALGNRHLASCQVNFSNLLSSESKVFEGHKLVATKPATFGLLDIQQLVKAMDVEFKDEIKKSRRHPGLYAIRNNVRLEYRSLPNCVVGDGLNGMMVFLARLRKVADQYQKGEL